MSPADRPLGREPGEAPGPRPGGPQQPPRQPDASTPGGRRANRKQAEGPRLGRVCSLEILRGVEAAVQDTEADVLPPTCTARRLPDAVTGIECPPSARAGGSESRSSVSEATRQHAAGLAFQRRTLPRQDRVLPTRTRRGHRLRLLMRSVSSHLPSASAPVQQAPRTVTCGGRSPVLLVCGGPRTWPPRTPTLNRRRKGACFRPIAATSASALSLLLPLLPGPPPVSSV